MFCDCDKVLPLWDNLSTFCNKKCCERLNLTTFQKMFGLDLLSSEHSRGINFLILYLKFYIYRCKFQQCSPNFQAFLKLVQIKIKTEYRIAEKKGKLSKHLKKFTFDFDANWFFLKNNWLVYGPFSFDLILVMFLFSALCTDVLGILIVWSACTHVPCSML